MITQIDISDLHARAISYAKRGFAVLPLYGIREDGNCECAQRAICKSSGKHPRTQHGVNDAPNDVSQIAKWWTEWPNANIGIATGKKSNLFVIDVDLKSGGHETMKKKLIELGPLPKTVRAESGGGGYHLLFLQPDFDVKKDSDSKTFGPGVDVLGEGAYFVAVPSRHKSGASYRFLKGRGFASRSLKPICDPWLKVLRDFSQRLVLSKLDPSKKQTDHGSDVFIEGQRNTRLASLAGQYRQQGCEYPELLVKLTAANLERCKPPLADDEVDSIARSVSRYELIEKNEVDVAVELCSIVLDEHFEGGRHLIFAADGQFWKFVGTHWVPARPESLQRLALLTIQKTAQKKGGTVSSLIAQFLTVLRARQSVDDDRLMLVGDPPPIFNCINGEVHLSPNGDVELKQHRAESYLRHCSDIVYDPEAKCPLFRAALRTIFADAPDVEEMCRHWNELVGYMLFPGRQIALILILLGSGNNGKTSLMQTLIRLVGIDRVSASRVEELESNRFMTGNLVGKHVFFDDDVKAGATLPDGSLKKISEAKLLTGELKYGNTFQFTCRTVPVLACNNSLSLADVSPGMIRRLMVVPFDHRFTKETVDKALFNNIWATEMSGILNFAIKGLQRVMKRELQFMPPESVEKATMKWLTQSNPLPIFIQDCCKVDPSLLSYAQELYKAFVDWGGTNGYKPLPQAASFQKNLDHLGYPRVNRGNKGMRISGLKLLNPTSAKNQY